ncbi:head-to-tail stopper [Streptomyces phage Francob]
MIRCLASAKFSMLADVIKPQGAPSDSSSPTGHWTWVQNPDTGAFQEVWETDDPNTPGTEGDVRTIKCRAKAAMTGSIKAAEQFGAQYLNDEWVKLELPYNADVTLRDRVTNIRTLSGQVLWSEEESNGNPATTFEVFRVSPEIDGFGNMIGKIALLKRAVVQ